MKKIDFGQSLAIAENLDVIGGLVLVALELRQTTTAILGATYEARGSTNAEWNLDIADSPTRAPLFIKYGQMGREGLTQEEQLRLSFSDGQAFS